MGSHARNFTPEQDARLRVLIAERLTASEIAAALANEGFPARTRNAILGRAHRLGLRLETTEARVKRGDEPKKQARPAPAAPKPAQAKAAPRAERTVSPPAPEPVAAPVAPPPADRPGIPFIGTRDGQCRFPLWAHDASPFATGLVCGAPTKPGSTYCPACYATAYQPRPLFNLARHAASFARHDGTMRRAPVRERVA